MTDHAILYPWWLFYVLSTKTLEQKSPAKIWLSEHRRLAFFARFIIVFNSLSRACISVQFLWDYSVRRGLHLSVNISRALRRSLMEASYRPVSWRTQEYRFGQGTLMISRVLHRPLILNHLIHQTVIIRKAIYLLNLLELNMGIHISLLRDFERILGL